VSDTSCIAWCPKTSSGYLRGGDGQRATIEGAGAASQTCGAPRGRGRDASEFCDRAVDALIERRFAVRLAQFSVWRLLRELGWSVQRPTKQARERNERAIRT